MSNARKKLPRSVYGSRFGIIPKKAKELHQISASEVLVVNSVIGWYEDKTGNLNGKPSLKRKTDTIHTMVNS